MTLQEFLAQNLAAKAEFDRLIAEARDGATIQGKAEAKAEHAAVVERVMPIVTSAAYPTNIKALAGDVLAGKKGIDAFDAAVTVYDANKEADTSSGAQAETEELGSVTPEAPDARSAGQKAVDDAWATSIADAKARQEQAAKEVR